MSSTSQQTSLALTTSTVINLPTESFSPRPSGTPDAGGGNGGNSSGSDSSNNNNNNNNNSSLATSSSLYLFTFLATLLLLLAISCAIVVRSFIIRRRFHRRVQDALAEGIILPTQPGQRRRDFGEKPKLWDAHLVPDDAESKWDVLMPVSVRVLSDNLSGAGQRLSPTPARPTFLQNATNNFARAQSWRPAFMRSRPPPPSSPTPAIPDSSNANADGVTDSPPEPIIEDARLQVSVFIAMPSPYRPRAWASPEEVGMKGKARSLDGEDEEVPDVMFGVSEVPWKIAVQPDATTPSEQASSNDV